MSEETTKEIVESAHEEIRAAFGERDISIREAVLKTWAARFSAKTIMDVLKIDEATLGSIVPRSLWFYDHRKVCPKCNGRGGLCYTDHNPPEPPIDEAERLGA